MVARRARRLELRTWSGQPGLRLVHGHGGDDAWIRGLMKIRVQLYACSGVHHVYLL